MVHLLGVLSVAVLTLVPFLNSFSLSVIRSQHLSGVSPVEWHQIALHLGIALVVWSFIVLFVAYVREHRKELGQGPRLVKARGTVIVETLIVLPVLLLLIFGISQLAITNVVNMLSNAAAFQAARSVALWEGEPSCTGECSPEAMGRLSAAMILAPVVPSNAAPIGSEIPEHLRQAMGMMVASQYTLISNDSGYDGITDAERFLEEQTLRYSFASAFDNSSFPHRSVLKLAGAHEATSVSVVNQGDFIAVTMTYRHLVAMPMVGYIYGEIDTVGERTAFYSNFTREITRVRNAEPNRNSPTSVVTPTRRFF